MVVLENRLIGLSFPTNFNGFLTIAQIKEVLVESLSVD